MQNLYTYNSTGELSIANINLPVLQSNTLTVMATMSSGKSTLINAILHQELLPSRNDATTAKILTITHDEQASSYTGTTFDKDAEPIVEITNLNAENVRQFNEEPFVENIEITGSIPFLKNKAARFKIVDTPGPNNSMDTMHHDVTYGVDLTNTIILYVLNATQFGINDDRYFLSQIIQKITDAGADPSAKIIFALNKVDEFDEQDKAIPDILKDVKQYLHDLTITEPTIIPISAYAALLLRSDEAALTRAQKRTLPGIKADFTEIMALEKDAVLPNNLLPLQVTIDNDTILHTGLPILEAVIQAKIKNAELNAAEDEVPEVNVFEEFRDKIYNANTNNAIQTVITDAYNDYQKQISNYSKVGFQPDKYVSEFTELMKNYREAKLMGITNNNDIKILVRELIRQFNDKIGTIRTDIFNELEKDIFNEAERIYCDYQKLTRATLAVLKTYKNATDLDKFVILLEQQKIKRNQVNLATILDNIGLVNMHDKYQIDVDMTEGNVLNNDEFINAYFKKIQLALGIILQQIKKDYEEDLRSYQEYYLNELNKLNKMYSGTLYMLGIEY